MQHGRGDPFLLEDALVPLRFALLAQSVTDIVGANSSLGFWLRQRADEAYRLAAGNKLLVAGMIVGAWAITKLAFSDMRK